MTALAKIPVRMSVDEFLAWEPGDGRAWQLVDGVPQAMSPASITHGLLQGELGSLVRNHLKVNKSCCRLVVAPGVVPRVNASHNMRVPDLAVTCSPSVDEQHALSEPVLIVEILSPSNQAETWANVWACTSIPSVREILILQSAAIGAEVLRRGGDGSWPQEPQRVTEGELGLESIGLCLPLAEVYAGTRLHR